MKTVFNYAAWLLFVIVFALTGCSDDKGEPAPETPEPSIEFGSETDLKPVVSVEGGTSTLTFTASDDWTASVNAVTRAIDWLSISPTQGGAGTVTLQITTQPNDTYDERNAAIVLSCGNVQETVTLTQKQKDALLITSNKVEVEAIGGTFGIELQANVDVSYEIEEAAREWLTVASSSTRGLTTSTLNFQASENTDTEARQAVITLRGGELTEKVTVYQAGSDPSILLSQKEYTVASDGETIQVELKSNVSYEVVMPEVQWITESSTRAVSSYTHYFVISPNETYDARSAEISFINKENNIEEKVVITQVQKDAIIVAQSEYTVASEGDRLDFSVNTNVDFTVETSVDWIQQVTTRGLVEKPLSFNIAANMTDNNREGEIIISYKGLKQKIKVFQGSDYLAKRHREALIALYKATNGDNWYNNTNWCSDKPIYEWYGVNHCYGDLERIKKDYVVSLYLPKNGLVGSLPEEFSLLMDSCNLQNDYTKDLGLDLTLNNIYGNIPIHVLNHSKWNEFGWYIIPQIPYKGNSLKTESYNLSFRDAVDVCILDPETCAYDGEILSQDLFKKNKLTLVYCITGQIDVIDLTKNRINMHLDYHNKGLSTIYNFWLKNRNEWFQKFYPQNLPSDILFTEGLYHDVYYWKYEPVLGIYFYPGIYIYDSYGNLIYYTFVDYNIDFSWYDQQVENILRERLGEPEEHPDFDFDDLYTSTDYSRDGEVFVLQKASVGKGIDLVFLGDGFVDKELEPDGYFEQRVREDMEKLFSVEPYKSLRNRFNIYGVKVVSPNNVLTPEAEFRIKENNKLCFEYASKISEINKEQLMIGVIYGPKDCWRAFTTMYVDGSFIAYIPDDETNILLHEIGGHGFAKLLDEYVEFGNEQLTLPQENQNELDEVWHNWGWGANVDWRNDVTTVKWAHFLKDSRYAGEELGLYEGAYLYGYGAYRPTENSMMRYNDAPFNAPSREQIYKTIMQMSEGESWTYNYEDFVQYDAINRNAATTRGLQKQPTEDQIDKWKKSHRPPVKIKGTWRDAMKKKRQITSPLR